MAWINMVDEDNAEGKLKEIYDKLMNPKNNKVANVLKVESSNPKVLEAHLSLYKSIMFGKSPLSRSQREMIAVVVSSVNSCHY
jgi:uncharacterized peroxidase-related enzyme